MAQQPSNLILVCGLGDIGQHCVSMMRNAGLEVAGLDHSDQALHLSEHLSSQLKRLVIGDVRQVDVLERAGLAEARAVLLVTGNDDVNLQAALIIRAIAPEIRIVLRSRRERLSQLLRQQFSNLVDLDPTPLTAQIIALSLLDAQLIGSFTYEGYAFEVRLRSLNKVTQVPSTLQEGWISGHPRTIGCWRKQQPGAEPELITSMEQSCSLERGDLICEVLGIEAGREASFLGLSAAKPKRSPSFRPRVLLSQINAVLQSAFEGYTARVLLGLLAIMLTLVALTQLAFSSLLPKLPAFDRLIYAIVLVLGNFSDLLQPLQDYGSSHSLLLLSIGLTITGTALVGVMYALFTDALLSRRLPFIQAGRRPPRRPQFLLWGQEELAVEVYHKLKALHQSPILVANLAAEAPVPDLPLISEQRLVNEKMELWPSLLGLAALKDDELKNLEAVLEVRDQLPHLTCILTTHKTFLHERIKSLLPDIQVINAAQLAASAFTSAALGEHVLSAIRFQSLTLLVMVYSLETQPNLSGLLVSDLIWGFLTIPLLYHPPDHAPILLPRNEIRLKEAGSVLVLTSQEGIQRVEQDRPMQPCWQLSVECRPHPDSTFEGTQALVQETGCPLSLASPYLQSDPPGPFPKLLYFGPAQRLHQRLQRLGMRSHLEALNLSSSAINNLSR